MSNAVSLLEVAEAMQFPDFDSMSLVEQYLWWESLSLDQRRVIAMLDAAESVDEYERLLSTKRIEA